MNWISAAQTRRRWVLTAGLLFIAPASATLFAEWPTARRNSGEISGTVVATATGRPLRGAEVSLSNGDEPARVMETDDHGRFVFERLPAGRYSLSAKQRGFLEVNYGQTRPGSAGPGVAIRLADGQRVERVVLAMPRGGAIAGVVLDPYGDPAFGASVTLLRYTWVSDQRILAPGDTATTDERGMYRIPVLPPGDYIVRATPPDSTNGEGADLASVYHPATVSAGSATVVTLGIAEERSGVDVVLQRITTHRVTGMVVDANGRPPARPLVIGVADADAPASDIDTGTQVRDGKFTIAGLPPGRYIITVLGGSGVHAMTTNVAAGLDDSDDDSPALWAQAEVTVLDRDISEVRLALQPGGSVSGRVAIDDGEPLPSLSSARVRIVPATSRGLWRSIPGASIDAKGGFTIKGIPPGRYRFSVDGTGAGATLRAALVEGRDALDFPFDVPPVADVTGVVLTVSHRTTELLGTLSDVTGQPTSDYIVVVFAADSQYWDPPSRRIVAVRPASDGRYAFRALPPGEYRLAAITDAEPGQWFDPRFLRELVSASVSIRLDVGEQRTLDVRVKYQVNVLVVNRIGAPAETLQRAQVETARLFSLIGVSVHWTEDVPPTGQRLFVIVDDEPTPSEMLPAGALGMAPSAPSERGVLAYVYYERVIATSRERGATPASLLSVCIAHELGHLLLPAHAHATEGLMKASWTPQDFAAASAGRLTFSKESAEMIWNQFDERRRRGGS